MVILLQGAMDVEVDVFLEHFKPYETKIIHDFEFYVSVLKEHTIIVSKTKKGIINATMATTIALMEFKPDLVINQGCAGATTQKLNVGDIVVGEKAVYINDFKTIQKAQGEGSNSLDWYPNTKRSYEIYSTKELLDIAKQIDYLGGLVQGTLGSGDVFSREYDRIIYLTKLFNHDCEDMESVAALKVCDVFNVNRLAVRIISNNELLGLSFDRGVCKDMQHYVIKLVDKILQTKTAK